MRAVQLVLLPCLLAVQSWPAAAASGRDNSLGEIIESVLSQHGSSLHPDAYEALSRSLQVALSDGAQDASMWQQQLAQQEAAAAAAAAPCTCECAGEEGEGGALPWNELAVNLMAVLALTVCAALAAGLTMGLVSIEPLEMAIKKRSGTPEEARQAERIYPLVTRHHFLLVTLLIFNSLANEALPLFLENMLPPVLAVIASVTIVLFFGEILPSAIFTGQHQLRIAAMFSPFVYALMFVFSPVAWPLAAGLDYLLGTDDVRRYNRAEISALVEVQHEEASKRQLARLSAEGGSGSSEDLEHPLHKDEVAIVAGVLQVGSKCVENAMIGMDKVYTLSMDQVLDEDCLADIIAAGHSRIPIYEDGNTRNIRGYLQVKKLIVISPEDRRSIRSLGLRAPEVVAPDMSLLELLNTFQLGRAHLALVSDDPDGTRAALKSGDHLTGSQLPIGIISLEDILEEILQEEILDESDLVANYAEARAKATVAKYTRKRQHHRMLAAAAKGAHALARTSPRVAASQNNDNTAASRGGDPRSRQPNGGSASSGGGGGGGGARTSVGDIWARTASRRSLAEGGAASSRTSSRRSVADEADLEGGSASERAPLVAAGSTPPAGYTDA